MFKVEYESLINGEWYVDHQTTETFAELEHARCAAELTVGDDSDVRATIWQLVVTVENK